MGVSLEDAITHAEKIAKIEEQACFLISNEDGDYDNHKKCGERYRQLAEWLKDYKRLREQEPCDAISRQAVIRWVKTECNPYGKPTLDFESGKKVIEHLKQMAPVTPQPKTGHWIKEPMDLVRCSKCGYKGVRRLANNYCPNCGAKMEEELQWFDIA